MRRVDRVLSLILLCFSVATHAKETTYSLTPADDELYEKHEYPVLTAPLEGASRCRMTPEELSNTGPTVLFQTSDLWNVIPDEAVDEHVGTSGPCLGPQFTQNPDELDYQGNPVGFTHAIRLVGTFVCRLKFAHGANSTQDGDMVYFTAYVKTRTQNHFMKDSTTITVETFHRDRFAYEVYIPYKDYYHKLQFAIPVDGISNFISLYFRYDEDLDIGGVKIENYRKMVDFVKFPETSIYYVGMEEDAPWRAPAAERIQQHRKGNFTIKLKDSSGNAIANQRVTIGQAKHDFELCGTVNSEIYWDNVEEYDKVLNLQSAMFNEGGFPNGLKWRSMGNSPGDIPRISHAFRHWQRKGLKIRGHAVMWPKDEVTPARIWREVERLQDEGQKIMSMSGMY